MGYALHEMALSFPFLSGVKNIQQYIIMIIRCLAKYCLADCTELMGGCGGMLCFCSLNYKNSVDFYSLKYKPTAVW
jgi:hypothetical protein